MSRAAVVAVVALVGAAAGARVAADDGDPLRAPGCRDALAALQVREAEAASAPVLRSEQGPARTIDPKLAAARRRAARDCLVSRADLPAPGRLAQPPIVVAPVEGPRAPLPLTPARAETTPRVPPAPPPPLTSITSCDAAGCWASDGSRLQRVGPTLWGPRGACSVQGTVVRCP